MALVAKLKLLVMVVFLINALRLLITDTDKQSVCISVEHDEQCLNFYVTTLFGVPMHNAVYDVNASIILVTTHYVKIAINLSKVKLRRK